MVSYYIQLIISLVSVVTLLTIVLFTPKAKRFLTKHLLALMGQTFVCGVILYVWGFWFGASGNFFTSTLRAIIASLGMFASHTELVEVSEVLKEENTFYMVCFSFIHFEALLLTLVFIIDTFGRRFVSKVTMKRLIATADTKKLFVFDGSTEDVIALAKSIPQDPDNVIVFVKGVVDPDVKSFSFLEAFLTGVKNRGAKDECEMIGYHLDTSMPLALALSKKSGWIYKKIVELISKSQEAEVYLITWDSQTNTNAAYNLSNLLPEGLNVKIFAGVNLTKPHVNKLDSCKYVIKANRSYVIVSELFNETPLLSGGNDKHTLIVGFGYTARNCVERLTAAGFRNVDVIDPEVADRGERFLCFHPDIRAMRTVRFFDYDTKSNAYWSYLRDNIASLSNVIVFGQDNAENYETAAMILKYARVSGKDLSDFKVFIMESEAQPGDTDEHIYPFGKRETHCLRSSIMELVKEK